MSDEVAKRSEDEEVEGDVQDKQPGRDIQGWYQRQDDAGRTDTSATLEPLTHASAEDWLGSNKDPDVLLSVPNLGVDHIGLQVDNLRAHVELHAKVLDLLELDIGADVSIDKVELNIENVRVQAMLKVRLERVVEIVDRVMDTIDKNPEILTNLTAGLGQALQGATDRRNPEQIEAAARLINSQQEIKEHDHDEPPGDRDD